jgi:hypothetical protein
MAQGLVGTGSHLTFCPVPTRVGTRWVPTRFRLVSMWKLHTFGASRNPLGYVYYVAQPGRLGHTAGALPGFNWEGEPKVVSEPEEYPAPSGRGREKSRNVRVGDELWFAFKDAVGERDDESASAVIRNFMRRYVRDTNRRNGSSGG